jgi:hypothetical protein
VAGLLKSENIALLGSRGQSHRLAQEALVSAVVSPGFSRSGIKSEEFDKSLGDRMQMTDTQKYP